MSTERIHGMCIRHQVYAIIAILIIILCALAYDTVRIITLLGQVDVLLHH